MPKFNKKLIIYTSFLVILAAVIVFIALYQLGLFPFSNTFSSLNLPQISEHITIEPVATNLRVPWAMAFPKEDEIFVTERVGRVRRIVDGELLQKPILELSIAAQGESGLMGMVLHPKYYENKYVYLCYAYEAETALKVKVERYQYASESLQYPNTIIDNIPGAEFHAGCELAFGPDGKLYITTGDASKKELAQNLSSLAGKILRLEADGTIPVDNPFVERSGARSEIWSYGHRNSQGITWNTEGKMYSVEHGPSGFDGPGGYDEVNEITRGENYGWPNTLGNDVAIGMTPSLKYYTPAIAPASTEWYSSDYLPEIKDTLLVAALKGTSILSLDFTPEGIEEKVLVDDSYGRIREIAVDTKGQIYFTTSNRDGRNNYGPLDDGIYKISKQSE